MSNFDSLREEFDRMTPEDQFRLGVAGVLRMAQQRSDLTMPDDRMGYSSNKKRLDDKPTDLSKGTISDMTSGMRSSIYRVKIIDAFQDIVAPLAVSLGTISDIEKVHANRLHHENTLYYQGIIGAVNNLGENNKQSFLRAMYLGYQSFLRHPMWSTFSALNQYIVKPIARLGIGTLFGFGKKSDTDRIVDAIKQQTEYMRTGAIQSPSTIRQLFSRGVIGFLAKGMIENVMSAVRGPDKSQSPEMKMVEVLQNILDNNIGVFKTLSQIERHSNPSSMNSMSRLIDINQVYSVESLTALHDLINVNSEILNTVAQQESSSVWGKLNTQLQASNDDLGNVIQMTGTDSYNAIKSMNNTQSNKLSLVGENLQDMNKDQRRDSEKQKEEMREHFTSLLRNNDRHSDLVSGFYEKQLEEQTNARKELESHNRRERFRATMRLLGGAGIRAAILGAGIAGILGRLSPEITNAITSGFRHAGRMAYDALGSVASSLRPENLGMLIGGAIMLTPLGMKIRAMGVVLAGVSYLTKKLNDFFGTSEKDVEMEREDRLNAGAGMRRAVAITQYVDEHPAVVQLGGELQRMRDTFFDMNESGIVTEQVRIMGDLINAKQEELRLTKEQIRASRIRGQIDQVAIDSAIQVAGGRTTSSLLSFIGEHESRGNYNALVYGNNTPREADLTNMTLAEVLQYQSGMRRRGHASSAVGKYQFLQGTLRDAIANTDGVGMDDMFSPEVQDKLAMFLLNRRGLQDFEQGNITPSTFARNLASEWASLPLSSGQSAYHGIAGNRAGVGYSEFIDVVNNSGRAPMSSEASLNSNTASVSELAPDMGILGELMDMMNRHDYEQSSNRQQTAFIDHSSIKELTNAFQGIIEKLSPQTQMTIDVTGIGD